VKNEEHMQKFEEPGWKEREFLKKSGAANLKIGNNPNR
jgi:hypothetical protein